MIGRVPGFEDVWREILQIARGIGSIRTLDLGMENQIVEVRPNEILVISERTGKERLVKKEDVRGDWEILVRKGSLRCGEEKSWHGSIVAAFLARLPYVKFTLKPRTLYLRR